MLLTSFLQTKSEAVTKHSVLDFSEEDRRSSRSKRPALRPRFPKERGCEREAVVAHNDLDSRSRCRLGELPLSPWIVLQKSQKHSGEFYAKGKNKRELPINAAPKPFPESPVSLPHGGEVPHIIIR